MESCDHCDTTSGECQHCVKGGLPFKKESLSFLVIVLIGIATVLTVLLVTAKREAYQLKSTAAKQTTTTEQKPAMSAAIPAPKAIIETVALPKPKLASAFSLEKAIAERRSRRDFAPTPVSLANLGQVLWAAQGVTDPETGKRAAPSAREVYPYTVYVVVRNVAGLKPGLYSYEPKTHSVGNLGLANAGELLNAAGVQSGAQNAPVVLVLSAAYGKGVEKMKDAAQSSALLEGGHIGQNIYLEVESLGMATVTMAGFDSKKVGASLKLDSAETPVYIIPLGNRAPEQPAAKAKE